MKKILFYLEPMIFRNDPLFLVPHFKWFQDICSNLDVGKGDAIMLLSSPALCGKGKSLLCNAGDHMVEVETSGISIPDALGCFAGNRRDYAQDLYADPNERIRNHYLFDKINSTFKSFDPDIVISTAANRYIQMESKNSPRRIGTFFIEKAPLPSWEVKNWVYLDPNSHQSNSLLVSSWTSIVTGNYEPHELEASRQFLARLVTFNDSPESRNLQDNVKGRIEPSGRETILIALQPDEWLSWEGALRNDLKPIDVLGKCCVMFPEFNIIPTFHRDFPGIRNDLLKDLKTIYPNIVDLPSDWITGTTERLLPLVDHVYTVSSATGISALFNAKNLICDARSYLSSASITSSEFKKGRRSALDQEQILRLGAYLLGRYCKPLNFLRTYEDFRSHSQKLFQPYEKLGLSHRIHRFLSNRKNLENQ